MPLEAPLRTKILERLAGLSRRFDSESADGLLHFIAETRWPVSEEKIKQLAQHKASLDSVFREALDTQGEVDVTILQKAVKSMQVGLMGLERYIDNEQLLQNHDAEDVMIINHDRQNKVTHVERTLHLLVGDIKSMRGPEKTSHAL